MKEVKRTAVDAVSVFICSEIKHTEWTVTSHTNKEKINIVGHLVSEVATAHACGCQPYISLNGCSVCRFEVFWKWMGRSRVINLEVLFNQCSILLGRCVCQIQIVHRLLYLPSGTHAPTGVLSLDPNGGLLQGVPRLPVPTLPLNPGYVTASY